MRDLPVVQATWVQFLGWEDPLEKEMTAHSNILAWRIPWTEEPGRLLFMGSQEADMTQRLSYYYYYSEYKLNHQGDNIQP